MLSQRTGLWADLNSMGWPSPLPCLTRKSVGTKGSGWPRPARARGRPAGCQSSRCCLRSPAAHPPLPGPPELAPPFCSGPLPSPREGLLPVPRCSPRLLRLPPTLKAQALRSASRSFPPGAKPGPGPLRPFTLTLSGASTALAVFPAARPTTPPGAPALQVSPRPQPIPPIRPRRWGSAVTHRRAGRRLGAGMRSLPRRAHLPGARCWSAARPGPASGGCFLSPRGRRAPTAPAPNDAAPATGISEAPEIAGSSPRR